MKKFIRSGASARIGIAALGVGILTVAGSGVAFAEDQSVAVNVEIEPNEDGVLALTVAGSSAELTEQDPAGTDRVFSGDLPSVTVTDGRDPANVDPDVYWYVLGSITDFSGPAGLISSSETFGWTPKLLIGDDDGLVSEGPPVDPGAGFDADLLAASSNSAEVGPGQWTADAELTLQTPATVAPGLYSATLTLSLLEDDGNTED